MPRLAAKTIRLTTEQRKALTTLRGLLTAAKRDGSIRDALSAQKEINKLLGLYADEPTEGRGKAGAKAASEAEKELDAIRAHLHPLKLAGETYPLREHARIAAERIREHQ